MAADGEWVPHDIDFGSRESWARLRDCYGSAEKTPDRLKALFSPNATVRENAVYWLYAALFHQGGRFEATVHAVPLLFTMLEHPDCPSRAFLIEYLVSVAHGYAEELPYTGVNPPEHIAALKRQIKIPRRELDRRTLLEPYCETETALAVYQAIFDRRHRLLSFLDDADPEVAARALVAVGLLLADDPAARVAVAHRLDDLAQTGGDFPCLAAALVAYGTMDRAMGRPPDIARLSAFLEVSDHRLRFLGALGLATRDTLEALRVPLITGLFEWKTKDAPAIQDVWCSPRSLAMEMIADFLTTAPESDLVRWIDAFIANVGAQDVEQSLNATRTLLALVSPDPPHGFRRLPAANLTILQRRALEAIRDHGLWTLSGEGDDRPSSFLNYIDLVRSFGLPRGREGLAAYLCEDGPPADGSRH